MVHKRHITTKKYATTISRHYKMNNNRNGLFAMLFMTMLTYCMLMAIDNMTGFSTPASGQSSFAAVNNNDTESHASFVLRAGKIFPVATNLAWIIEDGVIVVRDGKIVDVGPYDKTQIPYDLKVIYQPEAIVMPGFVSATGNIAGTHNGENTIATDYNSTDGFNRYGDYRSILAGGVTTTYISPGWHRLISGQGAVVKLGGDPDTRILVSSSDITINLGNNVFNPPQIVDVLTPSSGDVQVQPARSQRPNSRMGQFLALKEAITAAQNSTSYNGQDFDTNIQTLGNLWQQNQPIRIQAQESADIAGALHFLQTNNRNGYLVGAVNAQPVAEQLDKSGIPLVYTVSNLLHSPAGNLGNNPENTDADIQLLSRLLRVKLALATPNYGPVTDLRLAAATALRAGMSEKRVIEGITRIPAEILGVADIIGSLEPGKHADMVVLSGGLSPLDTSAHVLQVFIEGNEVYSAPDTTDALVVNAATIWLGPGNWLNDGSILIENGKIVAVGKRVPHPANAKVIDAGPKSFITPGLIDAFGHLGLDGDNSATPPEMSLERIVGAPDIAEHRVAQAGITTVMTAPYRFTSSGSQITAIKTAGRNRADRVVKPTTAIAFDVRGNNPNSLAGNIKSKLEAGQKYLEKWQKYEKDLAEWEKQKAEGKITKTDAAQPKTEEEEVKKVETDPVTGTWSLRAFGGPLPEDMEGKMALKLTGNQIEGRIVEPFVPVDHKILGTLTGKRITGTIEIDTGGMGNPTWEAEIKGEDFMAGTAGIEGLATVNFEATRTDKGEVAFKVEKRTRKTQGEDGRPLPPKVEEDLEPIKALLEKRIPILVSVGSDDEIGALLNLLNGEYDLPVILLGAEGASEHIDRLIEKNVGVVLPPSVMRYEDYQPYYQGDDLARSGVAIAFQSNVEDGARSLPLVALYAVERGLSAESALAALSINAAKMYQLDDRIGSIAPGRDGDLVIFSGHPFDTDTIVKRVIINGKEVSP